MDLEMEDEPGERWNYSSGQLELLSAVLREAIKDSTGQTVKEFAEVLGNTKVILMGGIRDPLKAEKLFQEGTIDFIALSRPLIIEPSLPNRWKNGDLSPPLCTSCNACFGSIRSGPVKCTIKEKLLKDRENI